MKPCRRGSCQFLQVVEYRIMWKYSHVLVGVKIEVREKKTGG